MAAASEDNPSANVLLHDARNGAFNTNVSMARHRMFESAFEGQLLGRKLAVTDPITLVGNHIAKTGQAIAARGFMERLVDKNVRASDGRPMVDPRGAWGTYRRRERRESRCASKSRPD